MNLKRMPVLLGAASLGVLFFAASFFTESPPRKHGLNTAALKEAPDFTLLSASRPGARVHLKTWASGKPVLVVFWATWCPPCIKEVPVLEDWHRRYSDRFLVLAVHVGDSREPIADFIKANGISYEVLLDEDSSTASRYGVAGLPVAVMLDPGGKILYYGFSLPSIEDVLKFFI